MIIVPQEISQKAFYSIPIFVVCYFVFKYLQYEYAEILLLLALTSYLHWRKVMKISIVKILDIITSVSTIVLVTIYSSKKRFNSHSCFVWNTMVIIIIIAFIVNEVLFYNQVMRDAVEYAIEDGYHYFTLGWTAPDTIFRQHAYHRSVYTHMFFFHILPSVVAMYCALHSHYWDQCVGKIDTILDTKP